MTLLTVSIILLNTIIYTNFATQDLHREMIYGSWSHAFYEDNGAIKFETVGTYNKVSESVGSFDNAMFELSNFEYYNGRQAENETEAIMTVDEIQNRNLTYELNQKFTIDGIDFNLVGIIYAYGNDWVKKEDFEYPPIITTNIKSDEAVLFGKAENLTQLYEPEDYILVNTNAHPFIRHEGDAADMRYKESLIMDQQS